MLSITLNGEARQFAEVATIADLIGALELAGKRLAVERNGEIVPKSRHALEALHDGDALEVVVAVGGG
ncbi:sulfur carrier protein ThiS [Crenobacter sp. SG2303]|uniref:Sulfur carrier protein ThiS n=1 Tax=Crenobacter oryzisoli TaxID=3056844 RepID=A0ABT7XUB2_9NEIS|nr:MULTISPECIES: sulfur carrier protein ThiS [unclassified Crenobacter]MDN0077387.1 sulfur carrier protein ThiS [Crenobacter sp. SG2303]MDN0085463.1 sulfur carrier protein ThiS [Crenobacter sp. SG2305]